MSYRHAAGRNQLHPEQALCLKALSLWNGGLLVQLFINLPRACQGLLPPVQCHLQAYVGRIPCVHQMHAKFERPNSWSPPFLSQKVVWKHEGCSCHEGVTLWMCLTWPAMRQELVFALVSLTFSPQGSEEGRACWEAGQCWGVPCRRLGCAASLPALNPPVVDGHGPSAGPPQNPCTGNWCLPHYIHKLLLFFPNTSANGELSV